MTRWITPALAFGVATSEASGNSLWKSPSNLSLSQSAGETNGYNPGNIVLDYMGQCTETSVDKDSCLISTVLGVFMNSNAQTDGCSPPSIVEEDLLVVLNESISKCSANGQSISYEEVVNAKSIFQHTLTDTTCFLQMCQEFADPSPTFMEIVFDEAARCAGVELNVDECVRNIILDVFSGGGGPGDDSGRLLRFLEESGGHCSTVAEQHAGATLMLQSAQDQCGATLSSVEFNAAVVDVATIFGSPQCFGMPPCSSDETYVSTEKSNDNDFIAMGIRYIEECADIEFDRGDCLVSTVIDIISSSPAVSRRRFLQEGSNCTAPSFEEDMLLAVLAGARQQCLSGSVEYSEEEYQQKVNQTLNFFGAESCWIDLCEEAQNPTETFMKLYIEEVVAVCAGAQLDLVNQCLVDGVFDVLFSSGPENQTFVGENMPRRVLQILSHNGTEPSNECGPSEQDIGPFIGLMLYGVEQNCTASGELISQADLLTAYQELVKLFLAPPHCWGDNSTQGCKDSQDGVPQDDNDDNEGLGFYYDVAVKYVEQCAGLDFDMDDCFISTAFDMLTSGQPLRRRRFLQESSPCDTGGVVIPEELLLGVFSGARMQCSSKSISYTTEEYEQRMNQLQDFFGAESCWIDLCEESMDPSDTYMTIFMESAAECAGSESEVVNKCLWDNVISFLGSMIFQEVEGSGAPRRMLSHNDTAGDMCQRPSDAQISGYISPVLMEAGQSCIDDGEILGQADIDAAYTELVKMVLAPPKCYGAPMDTECENKDAGTTQDEIDSDFVRFVREGVSGMLISCAGVEVDTCVSSKSLELLHEKVHSCAPPTIDEVGLGHIADAAQSWCLSTSMAVDGDDNRQAVDNMMKLVSSPDCWEDICHHDEVKNEGYRQWMGTCAYVDSAFLYSNEGSIQSEMGVELEHDKLKCMTDYILTAKNGDEESRECSVLKLGPNVCGTNFDLGMQAYVACSDDIDFTEHPTPSPVSFSMSYSFEQDPLGWDEFQWTDVVGVPVKVMEVPMDVADVPVEGIQKQVDPIEMEHLPYEMSFSYSFDDVPFDPFDDMWELSMSYGYDDSFEHDDDDSFKHDDDEPLSPQEKLARSYVMEVCHFLESMQYNRAARDCMKPICEIGLEGAFLPNSGGDTEVAPSTVPTRSPSSMPFGDVTASNTTSPSRSPSAKPNSAPTTMKPTIKPTTLSPTKSPTASPTKAKFGSVDVKFDAAVTLEGINVSDLDFTALGAVVDLLEKVFASILPEGALVRLLKVGGVSVTRRMLRNLQDSAQGVEVEFEVTITETCEDAECSNSEDISAAVYSDATTKLQKKVEDGSLTTAIQEEAGAAGVPELANVSIKPDSLKASAPTVTVKKVDPETDDDPTDDDSASSPIKSAIALLVVTASALFFAV